MLGWVILLSLFTMLVSVKAIESNYKSGYTDGYQARINYEKGNGI